MFAVFQEAVYRHACVGIFTTEARARHAADVCAETDKDNHHYYRVYPFPVDAQLASTIGWTGHEFQEAPYVYEVSKRVSSSSTPK